MSLQRVDFFFILLFGGMGVGPLNPFLIKEYIIFLVLILLLIIAFGVKSRPHPLPPLFLLFVFCRTMHIFIPLIFAVRSVFCL